MEQPSDAATLIRDGRVGEREKGLLELASEAAEEHPLIFEIHRLAGARPFERFSNDGPCAGPGDAVILAQRARGGVATTDAVPVVVDLGVVWPPDDIDREIR